VWKIMFVHEAARRSRTQASMNKFVMAALLGAAAMVPFAALAQDAAMPAMPDGAMGATFDYTLGVQTSKGKKSSSGQIVVRPAEPGRLTLTVRSSDGTSQTIPLAVSNGSVSLAGPSPSPSSVPAAAQTLMANMKLAATVAIAAKTNAGAGFTVPVTLTPIGEGTPVPAQVSMKPAASSATVAYSGTAGGSTMTVLPASGGLDPAQLIKGAGIGMVTHGLTPAGRIASRVALHHREHEEKEAAKGAVSDAMSLTITTAFATGRFVEIHGAQTDAVKLAGKTVKIYSTWSFTKVP
jgi:hypothetical protein